MKKLIVPVLAGITLLLAPAANAQRTQQSGLGWLPPPSVGAGIQSGVYTPSGLNQQYGYRPGFNAPFGVPGYYSGPAYGNFPVYGAPVGLGGNYFGFNAGGVNINMWRAPSGYYYPWGYPAGYGYSTTVIQVPSSGGNPEPAQPALATMFSDLLKYLDESKEKGKISDGDYQHLTRRCLDLQSKASTYRMQGNGTLDTQVETDIRRDFDQLAMEVSRRVKR